ncbi:MAG: gliding motility-associated C-terminal domain-containing protein, partial [Bacteroidota bacterium]
NAQGDADYSVTDLSTGQPVTVTSERFENGTLELTLGSLTQGEYTLEVTADRYGCVEVLEDQANIAVRPNAGEVSITSAADLSAPLPVSTQQVSFSAQTTASEPLTYVWNLDSERVGDGQTYSRAFDEEGTFTLELEGTTPDDCVLSDEVEINVEDIFLFNVPTVFTPNGDGINDRFNPETSAIAYDLQVYDRNGRLVYSGDQDDEPWDGTYDGNEAPEGVYMFRFEYRTTSDPIYEGSRAGSVTLLR